MQIHAEGVKSQFIEELCGGEKQQKMVGLAVKLHNVVKLFCICKWNDTARNSQQQHGDIFASSSIYSACP